MIILFFGPPGVGKGTQAEIIAQKYSLKPISTGGILRAEVAKGTPLGKQVKETIEKGLYPEDSLILDLLKKEMDSVKSQGFKGVILDGVPRTYNQAEALSKMLKEEGKEVDAVVLLEGKEKDLIERIKGRFVCTKCGTFYHEKTKLPKKEGICDICEGSSFVKRSDDTEETLRTRLDVYKAQTEPLISYYEKKGVVYRVDGLQPITEVTQQIEKILKEKLDS